MEPDINLRARVLMAIHDFEKEHGGPSINELHQYIGVKELKPLDLAESIISLENMMVANDPDFEMKVSDMAKDSQIDMGTTIKGGS